jgi:hypothetical protein
MSDMSTGEYDQSRIDARGQERMMHSLGCGKKRSGRCAQLRPLRVDPV